MELLIHVAEVVVDRSVADAQKVGNFLVEVAFDQKLQDFPFPVGQLGRIVLNRGGLTKGLNDLAGNVAVHGGTAGVHLLDGFLQFFQCSPL